MSDLTGVAERLKHFDRPLRAGALKEELARLNEELRERAAQPGGWSPFIPLLPASDPPHKVLRFVEDEAALPSRQRMHARGSGVSSQSTP